MKVVVLWIVLTFALGIILMGAANGIARHYLPSYWHYVKDGKCDICGDTRCGVDLLKDGQPIGEFCQKHVWLYSMAHLEVAAPFDIMFISHWVFFLVGLLLALPFLHFLVPGGVFRWPE